MVLAFKRERNLIPQMKGRFKKSSTLGSFNSRCNICLEEKISNIRHKFTSQQLNERNELIFKCRHKNRFKLIWKMFIELYTGILNTCTRLWLTESEQVTPMDSIKKKDVVRSSVNVPEFNKHLKKARRHIGQNVVEITIKMKTTLNDKKN